MGREAVGVRLDVIIIFFLSRCCCWDLNPQPEEANVIISVGVKKIKNNNNKNKKMKKKRAMNRLDLP